ncbi:hypothetical protein N7519_004105 [Penicillium mononematosum]|uniref:uncharacterized protein n=1 Tax=Penicillium mononematosum TaxID=268346 RepID=UPI002548EC1E|nr:uncharacterized protein N7519_004105 [Penicillium mononematosum]KAJ6189197.1 hypothetical protein N7519_004105 [Penicillium mononematosum]
MTTFALTAMGLQFAFQNYNGNQAVLTQDNLASRAKIGRRSNPEIVLESWKLDNDRLKRQQEVKVHKGENKKVYVGPAPSFSASQPLPMGAEWWFGN